MYMHFIPVSEPNLCGNEEAYVLACLKSTWISSRGEYINRFERRFAEYLGVKQAVVTSNGTTALHLILRALGIGPGDQVIVPTLTYVASANAVLYVGAEPVFVDCDPADWNMRVEDVWESITPRTRAIMAVHLYGALVDMAPLRELCDSRGIKLIEDAAEALGGEYMGVKAGALGDLAAFSFFGNKTITTGEGGMVTTNDDELAQRIRQLKDQGQSANRRYWHDVLGYNYRMTNIQAAIGLAQLENVDRFVSQKRKNAHLYQRYLSEPEVQHSIEKPGTLHSYWMYSILLKGPLGCYRDEFMERLRDKGVETRPFFYPIHTLPIYCQGITRDFPIAEEVSARGINLPSSTKLTEEDIIYICDQVRETLEELKRIYG
jgi:perosamine synthetase